MAYQDVDKVFHAHIGNPTAKYVLLLLAWHKNGETGECFPSIQTLAKESELSKNTVKSALDFLITNRIVTRVRCTSTNGKVTKTKYCITLNAVSANDVSNIDVSNSDGSKIDGSAIDP